jgi:uncharacterized protein YuzE
MLSRIGTTPARQGGATVRISYFQDDDYLYIRFRSEAKGTVAGADIAPGVVLLTDDEGTAIEMEIDSASKRLDLGSLPRKAEAKTG